MSLWARFCALSSTWRPRGQRTLMMRCGLVAQPGRHPWRSPPSVPVAVLLKKFKKCSFVFGRILFYIVFSGFVHSSTSPGGSYFALSSGFVLRGAGALCLAAHHLLSTPSYHANAPGGAQSCNSHTHTLCWKRCRAFCRFSTSSSSPAPQGSGPLSGDRFSGISHACLHAESRFCGRQPSISVPLELE